MGRRPLPPHPSGPFELASLAQEVGLALGTCAGEARLRVIFGEAGYTRFRRATETPMNLVLEARP